jgi:hypothetical protein
LDDADADPDNEIQTLTSTDGSVTLAPNGNDYDLSVAAADGTETKVNAGPNVTVVGDGSTGTPYVVSVPTLDDDDASQTNELTDLALASDILTLTNPLTAGNQINLSGYLDNTDSQNLTGATLGAGNILQIDIESGDSASVDLSPLAIEPWQVQGTTDKATLNTQDIYQMGMVGIGTTDMLGTGNTDVMLAVNGSILTTTSIYADYVFEDYFDGYSTLNANYNFRPLNEVERYINNNRHLPGITKIDALMRNEKGDYVINPTELSVQLLEKVEELYLHTIEQQKQLEARETEIETLKNTLKAQTEKTNKRLERLEELLLDK